MPTRRLAAVRLGGVRALDYPEETTTRNGMLATIEAIAPDDEAQFFFGFVWPLGEARIGARWARSGVAADGRADFDIDPASSDVRAIIARYVGATQGDVSNARQPE